MRKLFIPVLLLIITSFLLTGCQASDPMAKPYVSVDGSSTIKAAPDTVEVRINIVSEAPDATAQAINAEKAEKIIKFLKDTGLEEKEIKTIGANFYPHKKWENGKEIDLGYKAENSLQIKTKKLELISKIIDGSIVNGAERVNGLTYSLSEEGKDGLMSDLIASAINDAKTQAESAATSLGETISGVKSVIVIKEYSSPIYREKAMLAGESSNDMTPTPVLPGELDYTINVSVEFFIK